MYTIHKHIKSNIHYHFTLMSLCMVVMVLAYIILPCAGVSVAKTTDSCGKSASYTYDETDKVLTISGTGSVTAIPTEIRDTAKKVIVKKGITTINAGIFGTDVSSVSLPSSLKTIGADTFGSCYSLKSLTIPKSVTKIGNDILGKNYLLRKVVNKSGKKINLSDAGAGLKWSAKKKALKKKGSTLYLLAKGTATAKAKKYTISYDLSGGKHIGTPIKSYTYGQDITFGKAEKDGEIFAYWHIVSADGYSSSHTYITDSKLTHAEAGNIKLKAVFTSVKTFILDGVLTVETTTRRDLPVGEYITVEYASFYDMSDSKLTYMTDENMTYDDITHHTTGLRDSVSISGCDLSIYYIKLRVYDGGRGLHGMPSGTSYESVLNGHKSLYTEADSFYSKTVVIGE